MPVVRQSLRDKATSAQWLKLTAICVLTYDYTNINVRPRYRVPERICSALEC